MGCAQNLNGPLIGMDSFSTTSSSRPKGINGFQLISLFSNKQNTD